MIVVVDEEPTLAESLRARGFEVTHHTPESAHADLGFPVGAHAVVLVGPPGAHPILEEQAFLECPTIHVHGQPHVATVGPAMLRGSSPCTSCLRAAFRDTDWSGESPRPVLLDWISATVAMDLESLYRGGRPVLTGRSLTWTLVPSPALRARAATRRPQCSARDCAA